MPSYQEIAISEVLIPEHRRQTDTVKVEALAESIRDTGLQHPIGLRRDKRLIHGRHRLEAFKLLGREQIPALIHDIDDLHAELAEIDENIQRSELSGACEFGITEGAARCGTCGSCAPQRIRALLGLFPRIDRGCRGQ